MRDSWTEFNQTDTLLLTKFSSVPAYSLPVPEAAMCNQMKHKVDNIKLLFLQTVNNISSSLTPFKLKFWPYPIHWPFNVKRLTAILNLPWRSISYHHNCVEQNCHLLTVYTPTLNCRQNVVVDKYIHKHVYLLIYSVINHLLNISRLFMNAI